MFAQKDGQMSSAFQVLVVDDEPALREICEEALSGVGYDVHLAANGCDALDKLSRRSFDLVISDLRMPDMNGQDLLSQIRQRQLDVDFLVITGYGTTETAVEIMKNGAADYIAKPFDIKHLLLRVRSILDRRKARKEQEKLSAVVRMLNLSKRLGSQLNHVAVVEEFLIHLRENFTPDAVCLLMPEMLEQKPSLIQGRLLELSDLLRVFVTRLCEKIMGHGRSYLLDQFTLKQTSFNTAFFPRGFPYSVMAVPLDLPHKRIGVISLVRDERNTLYCEQDLQLLGVFASHTASALQNSHLYSRLRALNQDVIRSFAQAVEVKDYYTRGHSERVAEYACRLGRALGLGTREIDRLHIAGMLHDIGKIGIPDHILNKPGALTEDEYENMKRHSVMGREILGQVGAMSDVTEIIYHHHERMDGLGYPDGLAGDDVPFMARIICLADSYEAMTSNRAYRQALPLDKVLYALDRGAGTQWDKDLTAAWMAVVKQERPGLGSL
jgi:response regulator RpfG family c-di-GMP phosphodiesterase